MLGDGTIDDSWTPVDVSGLTSGVTSVSAGGNHTCALTATGGVKCWGPNYQGQLGDGTLDERWTPVDVAGLSSDMVAVTAGERHTCALTTSGGVKCWGWNTEGQLGDGTTSDSWTPVDVVGLGSGVTAIAAGDFQTCAVIAAGGVKCWGGGLLGDGTTNPSPTPVDVVGLGSEVAAVSAGRDHTCALITAGGVKCWGYNTFGQLGDGTTTNNSLVAVDAAGLDSGVTAISTGGWYTCALTVSGGVKCWGRNNYGQLGDGTTTDRLTPVDVVELGSGVMAVSAGSDHTCAQTTMGMVKCWGYNEYGQLGEGAPTYRLTPVDVVGLSSGVAAVSAGGGHTCALTDSGIVKCWGDNGYGELGDGTTNNSSAPVDVVDLGSGVAAVVVGSGHTCALTAAGGVKCWGGNHNGQLGDGTTDHSSRPVDVVGLDSGVISVAAGYFHTCALTVAGGVKCWGNNEGGALGDGTMTHRLTPVDVVGLGNGVAMVAAGWGTTCALTTSGEVKCWGYNGYGELGDGTDTDRLTPVDVMALGSGVKAVAVGEFHTCALTASGGVKCWGDNTFGQLGDGTTDDRSTPVDVLGLDSGVVEVVTGYTYTCALMATGGVKCWGYNEFGRLGDGTTTHRWTPVDVVGLGSGMAAVSAGHNHACALTTAGGVKCWGENRYGQLGDGRIAWSAVPIDVAGWESHTAP